MSRFIGALAFANVPQMADETKFGVLPGSVVSIIVGTIVLRLASRNDAQRASRR